MQAFVLIVLINAQSGPDMSAAGPYTEEQCEIIRKEAWKVAAINDVAPIFSAVCVPLVEG